MADFHNLVPEIRMDFDLVEAGFLAEASAVIVGSLKEKKEFVDYCFQSASDATQAWTKKLAVRKDLSYTDAEYRRMWQRFNAEAGMTGLPA
jgi:hypothetical protein